MFALISLQHRVCAEPTVSVVRHTSVVFVFLRQGVGAFTENSNCVLGECVCKWRLRRARVLAPGTSCVAAAVLRVKEIMGLGLAGMSTCVQNVFSCISCREMLPLQANIQVPPRCIPAQL